MKTRQTPKIYSQALSFQLLLAGSLWASLLSISAWADEPARGKVEFDRFSVLYQRQKNLSESVDRLAKMEDLRRGAQLSLERLMQSAPKKAGANAELELRYAELIVQRGRDLEQFSLEVDASGDGKRAKELRSLSHDLMRRGLDLHQKLLVRVKTHPMASKVYLGMARTEYALGRKPAALTDAELGLAAQRYATKKDDTELQLWILKGDAAFDLAKAAIALQAYASASKQASAGSMEEAYLFYKLAWVHYNLKDADQALAHLDKLFETTRDKFALRQEAVQDYALFVGDISRQGIEARGGFGGIYNHLSTKGDIAGAIKALERLGLVFAKNGRRSDAVALYEFLIQENTISPANVDRAITVVEWAHSLANKKALTERYFWLITNFGPQSSWFAAQSAKPQVQRTATDKIESSVRKYSLALHQESMKETQEELRRSHEDVVASLYDAHIKNFSRATDAPRADAARIHYYRAEIHRRRNDWEQAGVRYDSYLRVLDLVPKDQVDKVDLKLKDEAIWGSIQVWSKAIDKNPRLVPSMLAAADRFLKDFPKHAKAPQVLVDAAKVELKSGNSASAIGRIHELVKRFPKTAQSLEGVNAELDILNQEKDWVNLAQSARRYMNSLDTWVPSADKSKTYNDLYRILSQTEAKACDALRQDSARQLESALCFESFAKGFAKDAQAPKALLNAADIYDKLKDASAAVGCLELLVKRYPDSEHAAGGFSRLATVYEKAFEFEKAAIIYETLLEKNANLKDRERLLTRMLTLFSALGKDSKFESWLNRKGTPESLRREFTDRTIAEKLVAFRLEEQTVGYGDEGLASPRARQFFAEIDQARKAGRITLEQELEYHRIRGIIQRNAGRMDKADEEWMAGLKRFWKASDRSPAAKESAARLRLEQASVWETAFRNTDLMKSPNRKAELFKKLEDWYAEVIGMKAPVIALEALWASAKLHTDFAEEVQHAPVPAELLVKGAEGQREAYERLIKERTEPMKQKAILIIEQIALKAREWKVVSPVVLSALMVMGDLRSGVQLPGQIVRVAENRVLRFPWTELPRWMDLSAEQQEWTEWGQNNGDLLQAVLQKDRKRSEARRAAFVSLARTNTLSQAQIAAWAKTFTDKAGVQLRLQALVNDRDLAQANLFLDQYESFFGADAFTEHYRGRLEWAEGKFEAAYLHWIRPTVAASQNDFRSVYWNEGWASLLDELIEGTPDKSRRANIFAKLHPLAKQIWQQHYVAKLCLTGKAECRLPYASTGMVKILTTHSESPYLYRFDDNRSGWQVHQEALNNFLTQGVGREKSSYGELDDMRKALSSFYALHKYTQNAKVYLGQYWSLRSQVDRVQDRLDAQSRDRIVAGAKQ